MGLATVADDGRRRKAMPPRRFGLLASTTAAHAGAGLSRLARARPMLGTKLQSCRSSAHRHCLDSFTFSRDTDCPDFGIPRREDLSSRRRPAPSMTCLLVYISWSSRSMGSSISRQWRHRHAGLASRLNDSLPKPTLQRTAIDGFRARRAGPRRARLAEASIDTAPPLATTINGRSTGGSLPRRI